jgi:hypothetical protein
MRHPAPRYAQLRNAIAYRRNISHQSPFQSFDPGHDHAADRLVLEAVDPGRELRKRSDREPESIVIVRLHGCNLFARSGEPSANPRHEHPVLPQQNLHAFHLPCLSVRPVDATSMRQFKPHMEILPPRQQQLRRELKPSVQLGLVLQGGPAIGLRLGPRLSVDFDFFAAKSLNQKHLKSIPA